MTDEIEASISLENSQACSHNVCDLCRFLYSRHLPLGKARHLVARAFALPTTGCALLLTLRLTLSLTCLLAREVFSRWRPLARAVRFRAPAAARGRGSARLTR